MKKFMQDKTIQQRLIVALFFLALILILIGIFSYLHTSYNIGIPCVIHTTTGLDCPGCGMTRATVSVFKLDFQSAFEYNPIVFLVIPLLAYLILGNLYAWVFQKKFKELPIYIIISLAILVIVFTIFRNLH